MEKLQSQGAYKVKLENPLEAWPTTRLSVDINYKADVYHRNHQNKSVPVKINQVCIFHCKSLIDP
jgi:hypothetical protein